MSIFYLLLRTRLYAIKTYTPNYLDHKVKKNRHDRNQYKQSNHHEGIVSHEIFEAAQKLLAVHKYRKCGYPLPELRVVDGGALRGYVSVNRTWTGFTGEDYKKASESAYSDLGQVLQKSPSQPHLHAVLAPPCRSFSPTFTH